MSQKLSNNAKQVEFPNYQIWEWHFMILTENEHTNYIQFNFVCGNVINHHSQFYSGRGGRKCDSSSIPKNHINWTYKNYSTPTKHHNRGGNQRRQLFLFLHANIGTGPLNKQPVCFSSQDREPDQPQVSSA